jgi:hypothetical protein
MSMNEIFAQYYNTLGNGEATDKTAAAAPAPTQEDLTKQAQYELFAKVAHANGIDLSKLTDAQCDELFERTMAPEKTAGEMPPQFMANAKGKKDGDKDEDDESKKKEMAEKEHAEKKAAAVMFQQADAFGRQAAHAYVDELKKVAAAVEAQQAKEAAPALPAKGETYKRVGERLRDAVSAHGGHAAAAAGGAAAGGAAGYAAGKNKKASALDELAANRALAIVDEFNKQAGANGFNLEEASERIAAVVFTLGLADSTKIAAAADVNAAIEIRALEALEAAGYPVQWPA